VRSIKPRHSRRLDVDPRYWPQFNRKLAAITQPRIDLNVKL